jgi:hypothetical protein
LWQVEIKPYRSSVTPADQPPLMRSPTKIVVIACVATNLNSVARLEERGIPFMIHSEYEKREGECKGTPHVNKPAKVGELVAAMENLLGGKTSS